MTSDGSPRHSLSSSAAQSTSSSPKTLVLQPSIPEHHEISSVSDQEHRRSASPSPSSPSKVIVASRRSSVAVTPSDDRSHLTTDSTSISVRTASDRDRRRRSVPTVTTLDNHRLQTGGSAAINIAKARRLNQLRITEILSNFPKVSTLSHSLYTLRASLCLTLSLYLRVSLVTLHFVVDCFDSSLQELSDV